MTLSLTLPSPGNIYAIRILQLTPVFGSIYDILTGRSRYNTTTHLGGNVGVSIFVYSGLIIISIVFMNVFLAIVMSAWEDLDQLDEQVRTQRLSLSLSLSLSAAACLFHTCSLPLVLMHIQTVSERLLVITARVRHPGTTEHHTARRSDDAAHPDVCDYRRV